MWSTALVAIGHGKPLTSAAAARYFRQPRETRHRQYEALRAYFLGEERSAQVAHRFGYTPAAFRVLCHRFRQRAGGETDFFFKPVEHGPQAPPTRDRLRERVVALRKRNLSVYDIQTELREHGEEVSINTLAVLLREEGFARLPRRRDEERPHPVRPESAAVADARLLDLSPRCFRTRFAGLFVFVPLLKGIDLESLALEVGLPGSEMIPAAAALRSFLALKLIGVERTSHVMQHVLDEGLALFAGLNALPKRSYLAAYSSRVSRRTINRLMETWFRAAGEAGLRRGGSFDVDFHSVPANTSNEPLEKHYVSKRSRSQQAILVFLARDAEERVLCYANAAIPKAKRDDEIVQFAKFYKARTGHYPDELVFDSQLTTYRHLDWLNRQGIRFLTLRRRSKKMIARLLTLPPGQWRRVSLKSLTRVYRTPKVLEEKITLRDYDGEIRQLSITELGHEEPTILLTNHWKPQPAPLITRYAQRMLIENGIAEAIHFFHIDALTSMVDLKVDFDLQITLMGSALYRLLANRLPGTYRRATARTLFHQLLDVGGEVSIGDNDVTIALDPHAHNPILAETGLLDVAWPMPWLPGKTLRIQFR